MYAHWIIAALLIVSVHAGHKRVIIKVPQRTRHIYHHHVKKIPVYVLLPTSKKSRVVEDLEDATRELACKEPTPSPPSRDWREKRIAKYPYVRQYDEPINANRSPFTRWKEEGNEENNQDTYAPNDIDEIYSYRQTAKPSNQHVRVPMPMPMPFSTFRSDGFESSQENLKHTVGARHSKNTSNDFAEPNAIPITYHTSQHPSTSAFHSNDNPRSYSHASSFQYKIQHRNDITTSIRV